MSIGDREGPPSGSPLLWALLAIALVVGFVLLLRCIHPATVSLRSIRPSAATALAP